jgi:hypothetical protein
MMFPPNESKRLFTEGTLCHGFVNIPRDLNSIDDPPHFVSNGGHNLQICATVGRFTNIGQYPFVIRVLVYGAQDECGEFLFDYEKLTKVQPRQLFPNRMIQNVYKN